MRRKLKEEQKEILTYGTGIGSAMFISNVIYLGLQDDIAFVEQLMPWYGGLYAAYLLFGMLFFLLYTRTPKRDGFLKYCFKGVAAVYMIGNVMPLFFLLGVFLANRTAVRMICLIDAAVLIGFYIFDYHSVWKLSNALNGRKGRTRTLLIDLDEKPASVEAFCDQIEEYCRKNHQTVEFLTKGRTCELLLDGSPCTVELEYYYSQFGPMYGMKFTWKR